MGNSVYTLTHQRQWWLTTSLGHVPFDPQSPLLVETGRKVLERLNGSKDLRLLFALGNAPANLSSIDPSACEIPEKDIVLSASLLTKRGKI